MSGYQSENDGADTMAVPLGHNESLVLFEMLSRWFEQRDPTPSALFVHAGEEVALIRLLGALETILVEPYMPGYEDLVATARSELVMAYGGGSEPSETDR